jgi:transcriptional regulator with XRE-family HTH domain
MRQEDLAAAAGLKQGDISKIENGKILKTTGLVGLARALRVDAHWLATGEGEMLPPSGWPGSRLTIEQIHKWPPELVKSVEDFALFQLSGAKAPEPETLSTSNNVFTADEHGNLSAQLPLETKRGRTGGKHSAVEAKRAQK